jgi:hypothetical protein
VDPIISSAIVAAIGTGDGFVKGRDFAAWLNLFQGKSQPGTWAKYRNAEIQKFNLFSHLDSLGTPSAKLAIRRTNFI